MPNYPPELADLTAPRLTHWIPPRRLTEVNPTWVGHRITLAHQPLVWYPAYVWEDNAFKATRDRLADVAAVGTTGYTPYAPIVLTVEGQTALDRTDYRSSEAPALGDYAITHRVEYFLDGRTLVTNVARHALTLVSSGVTVTYTSLTTRVQLVARLRTNTAAQATAAPSIDAYTIHVRPGLHPRSTD